jgi:hypothetical protein
MQDLELAGVGPHMCPTKQKTLQQFHVYHPLVGATFFCNVSTLFFHDSSVSFWNVAGSHSNLGRASLMR